MAAIGIAPEPVTIEAFLVWNAKVEERYELCDGQILAMAGASGNHACISTALAAICFVGLEGRECGFVGEGAKVIVPQKGSAFLPDGTIACPVSFENPSAGVVANPIVIFEVLSPSTESFDRTKKFDAYTSLPSVQDYVLIWSEAQRVGVFSRQEDESWSWRVFLPGTTAHIPSVALDLPLDRLYSRAIFEPTTLPDAVEN